MQENNQYLDYAGLEKYNENLKQYIENGLSTIVQREDVNADLVTLINGLIDEFANTSDLFKHHIIEISPDSNTDDITAIEQYFSSEGIEPQTQDVAIVKRFIWVDSMEITPANAPYYQVWYDIDTSDLEEAQTVLNTKSPLNTYSLKTYIYNGTNWLATFEKLSSDDVAFGDYLQEFEGKNLTEVVEILNYKSEHPKNLQNISDGEGDGSLQQKGNIAHGKNSVALGEGTVAVGNNQTVVGKYNRNSSGLFVVGSGDEDAPNNVLTVDEYGAYLQGNLEVGSIEIPTNTRITYNNSPYYSASLEETGIIGSDGSEATWQEVINGSITGANLQVDQSFISESSNPQSGTAVEEAVSVKQDINDLSLETQNKTVVGGINEVNSVAKGANQAVSYDCYSDLVNDINIMGCDVYRIGQNIYVLTLDVPDLWISGVESSSSTYTYTTDEAFVNTLKTSGYVQVGYYEISALESQKVDLTNYVQNTDYMTENAPGIAKIKLSYGIRTGQTVSGGPYDTLVLCKPTMAQIDARNTESSISRYALNLDNIDYAVKKSITDNKNNLSINEQTKAMAWIGSYSFLPIINKILRGESLTDMSYLFKNNTAIKSVPLFDFSKVTNMVGCFENCTALEEIPALDTSALVYFYYCFRGCTALKTVPSLDTSRVTELSSVFANCTSLETIGELDCSAAIRVDGLFLSCSALKNVAGLKDLGEAYSVSASENETNYRLDFTFCPLLTHDSIMNIINDLYDIATKGCQPQMLKLGETNLAKISAAEQAIATAKGWNLS